MPPLADLLLAAGVLGLGLASLLGSGRRWPVVARYLAFGTGMVLVWLRLGALDLALAEAALGGGLIGALLLRGPRGAA